MKILTVCQRGNSRSNSLAYILKDGYGMDAIAIGLESNGEEAKNFLYEWADRIILVDKRFIEKIPEKYKEKLRVWDVGPDRFFLGVVPELMQLYQDYMKNDPL